MLRLCSHKHRRVGRHLLLRRRQREEEHQRRRRQLVEDAGLLHRLPQEEAEVLQLPQLSQLSQHGALQFSPLEVLQLSQLEVLQLLPEVQAKLHQLHLPAVVVV